MPQANFALFEFNPQLNQLSGNKKLSEGLSAVVLIGDEVWTANDETTSLERLSCKKDNAGANKTYCNHEHFPLDNYLALPGGMQGEIDIEGLDHRDGYLWLIGSHSLSRKQAKENVTAEENLKRLAELSKPEKIRNRYLLARIPLVEKDGSHIPEKETEQNGIKKTAAILRVEGNGNQLTTVLAQDELLKPFFGISSKDNGFDIEGLAVTDDGRVFIGLRGPVLRGWAIVLELKPEGENNSSVFGLTVLDGNPANTTLYRRHFFELGGLGIRDLYIDGSDLLILAGPTMDLDGPVSVFRWKEGVKSKQETFVWHDNDVLKKIVDIPYGAGEDHAEGMTSFSAVDDKPKSLMIVYDLAAQARQTAPANLIADIFDLQI
jgi:hypothetical protein